MYKQEKNELLNNLNDYDDFKDLEENEEQFSKKIKDQKKKEESQIRKQIELEELEKQEKLQKDFQTFIENKFQKKEKTQIKQQKINNLAQLQSADNFYIEQQLQEEELEREKEKQQTLNLIQNQNRIQNLFQKQQKKIRGPVTNKKKTQFEKDIDIFKTIKTYQNIQPFMEHINDMNNKGQQERQQQHNGNDIKDKINNEGGEFNQNLNQIQKNNMINQENSVQNVFNEQIQGHLPIMQNALICLQKNRKTLFQKSQKSLKEFFGNFLPQKNNNFVNLKVYDTDYEYDFYEREHERIMEKKEQYLREFKNNDFGDINMGIFNQIASELMNNNKFDSMESLKQFQLQQKLQEDPAFVYENFKKRADKILKVMKESQIKVYKNDLFNAVQTIEFARKQRIQKKIQKQKQKSMFESDLKQATSEQVPKSKKINFEEKTEELDKLAKNKYKLSEQHEKVIIKKYDYQKIKEREKQKQQLKFQIEEDEDLIMSINQNNNMETADIALKKNNKINLKTLKQLDENLLKESVKKSEELVSQLSSKSHKELKNKLVNAQSTCTSWSIKQVLEDQKNNQLLTDLAQLQKQKQILLRKQMYLDAKLKQQKDEEGGELKKMKTLNEIKFGKLKHLKTLSLGQLNSPKSIVTVRSEDVPQFQITSTMQNTDRKDSSSVFFQTKKSKFSSQHHSNNKQSSQNVTEQNIQQIRNNEPKKHKLNIQVLQQPSNSDSNYLINNENQSQRSFSIYANSPTSTCNQQKISIKQKQFSKDKIKIQFNEIMQDINEIEEEQKQDKDEIMKQIDKIQQIKLNFLEKYKDTQLESIREVEKLNYSNFNFQQRRSTRNAV